VHWVRHIDVGVRISGEARRLLQDALPSVRAAGTDKSRRPMWLTTPSRTSRDLHKKAGLSPDAIEEACEIARREREPEAKYQWPVAGAGHGAHVLSASDAVGDQIRVRILATDVSLAREPLGRSSILNVEQW
jgi:hypothetical protein